MRWFLVGVLGVVAGLNAAAQSGMAPSRTSHADLRVTQMLDAGSIRYSIGDDGDYRIINRIVSTRTQLCFVLSRSATYGKIEVLDVISE
jgi:hypothetical protein